VEHNVNQSLRQSPCCSTKRRKKKKEQQQNTHTAAIDKRKAQKEK